VSKHFNPNQFGAHQQLLHWYDQISEDNVQVVFYNTDPTDDRYQLLKKYDKVVNWVRGDASEAYKKYGQDFKGTIVHISKEGEGVDPLKDLEARKDRIDFFRYQGEETGLLYAAILYSERDKNKEGLKKEDGFLYMIQEVMKSIVQRIDAELAVSIAA
jgi:hypothetical protein